MNRFLGGYAKRVDPPWKMYPVGVLFGLGFDTATEVALLVLAGPAVVGGLPFYAVISLPVLFAAGMCLFDTIDGCFMNFAYDWAFSKPDPQDLLQPDDHEPVGLHRPLHRDDRAPRPDRPGDQPERRFWDVVAKFNINRAGFIIVGVFVATWVVALAVWHFGDIERKWETQAAQAYAEAGAQRNEGPRRAPARIRGAPARIRRGGRRRVR